MRIIHYGYWRIGLPFFELRENIVELQQTQERNEQKTSIHLVKEHLNREEAKELIYKGERLKIEVYSPISVNPCSRNRSRRRGSENGGAAHSTSSRPGTDETPHSS